MSQQFYKPAEACKIAEVAPYVLRYWETEFPVLLEGKEKSGPRAYTERDVKIIARIRELLYDEGFTVAGAKKRLEAELEQGRFESTLKAAPPPGEQRAARPTGPAAVADSPRTSTAPPKPQPVAPSSRASLAPEPAPAFLAEPVSKAETVPGQAKKPPAPFADRQRVLRELKEIVQILGRSTRK